jgi:ABC-type phosphate/phosphonate transport system substrate-binding protein
MRSVHRLVPALLGVLWTTGWTPAAFGQPAQKRPDPDIIAIGIVDSLVEALSPGKRTVLDSELPSLVEEFTGLKSRALQGGDPLTASKKLAAGEWHLGLFQGVEFGWAQAKEAKLKPLLIAVNRQPTIHALLLAKNDSRLKGFGDVKGKDIHVLQGRVHCPLFAAKAAQGDIKKFFGQVIPTPSVEEALDDILLDKVQAAVVDDVSLQTYKDVHPGRFKRLKVLAKSEPFPPTVVAYYEGSLSENILKKFRTGMLKANESARGREAMADVRITAFEAVPTDFQQLLSSVVKAYPPPAK